MKITLETLATLGCSGEKIDEILRQADTLPLRAAQVAEMLRSCCPSSPLYACLLEGQGHSHLFVVNEEGKSHSEWAERLHGLLSQCDKADERGLRLGQSGDTDRGEGRVRGADLVKLPQALKLTGYLLAVAAIAFRGQRWGVLALAVPKSAAAETLTAARLLLAIHGEQLAVRLDAEAQERDRQALQKELEGQSSLASTGELAGPLAHEFNNFLNIVLLHIALLEAEIPEKFRRELTELRRQGASMTSLVKQFQQYRRRQQPAQLPVDVNRLVLDTVRALAGSAAESNQGLAIKLPPSSKIDSSGRGRSAGVPLDVVLAPDLPCVLGSAADLRRLCTFLLTNAAAATATVGGRVTIQTEPRDNNVVLRVEDAGPAVSPESLPQFFEPAGAARPGTNSLELAACETLARRLQGKIRCEERGQGGLVVFVELPSAPD